MPEGIEIENFHPQGALSPAEKRTIEQIYQKKSQLEHILLRPDTYIGSVEMISQPMWVLDKEKGMVNRNITFVPGLYKIFDEILVNAADNKQRDKTMDSLKVEINPEENLISVWNNGKGIPVEIHKEEKIYVPELIFGHLLTSSNYDDSKKKVTGGRNGYGAKLANIFSTEFIVETGDAERGKLFKQVFKDNMGKKGTPKITNSKKDFTKISFRPDLRKFKMEKLDDDIVALLSKRVYDVAGVLASSGVKVYLNNERVAVRSFKDYCGMYLQNVKVEEGGESNSTFSIHERVNDRWEVCVSISDGTFQQVSFVNSICTTRGGCHVNYVAEKLIQKLIQVIDKKNKKMNVKANMIKNHLWVFVNCLIENPAFDSQTKETLTTRPTAFGSKCELSDKTLNAVAKSPIVQNVLRWAQFKQDAALKKTSGVKKERISGIPKLDDANNAGSKRHGRDCTLILTEGDSAKALAVAGLSVVGRDNYGVFPLRGKLLNVRDASHKQIMDNVEINHLKQILGLKHQFKYDDVGSLRYGHVMIMTDQDVDGSHIKGLLINLFHVFWPSLLQLPGFMREFITPIVKVTKGKQSHHFYTLPEYNTWKEANGNARGWKIKYYKGLGTSTSAEAKEYFKDLNTHRIDFRWSGEEDGKEIEKVFSKKKVEERKQWLRDMPEDVFLDQNVSELSYNDFINKELILFSHYDNIRSIPSAVDGFKPGQRKVLFSCFKRKLKNEIKVAQLSGYVSEHSAYHHGEAALAGTIVGMAQNYVGANNINLLNPNGMFGTRINGGKDAASARYIFTCLSTLSRLCFHNDDDPLLKYLDDDGLSIEPQWYMPVIPMVLVNGAEGIGTGWSSSVPNYNPIDIIRNIRRKINGENMVDMHPWYRGYTGTFEYNASSHNYTVTGRWTRLDDTTFEITELPIKSWTQPYKEFLESMLPNVDSKYKNTIQDFKEYHTENSVHFKVFMTKEALDEMISKNEVEKKFKLSTTLSVNNMTLFDFNDRIRRYESPLELIEEFYDLRLKFYSKRKQLLIEKLTEMWDRLDNKARFILMVVNKELVISNKKRNALTQELKDLGFKEFSKENAKKQTTTTIPGDDAESDDEDATASQSENQRAKGYDYLLSMPLWSLTKERVDKILAERAATEEELKLLIDKKPETLWLDDLDAIEAGVEEDELNRASEEKELKMLVHAARSGNTPAKRKRKAANGDEDYTEKQRKRPAPKPKTTAAAAKKTVVIEPLASSSASVPTNANPVFLPTATSSAASSSLSMKQSVLNFQAAKPADVKAESASIFDATPIKAAPAIKKATTTISLDSSDDDDGLGLSLSEQIRIAPVKKKEKPAPVKRETTTLDLVDDPHDIPLRKPAAKRPRARKNVVSSESEGEDEPSPVPKKEKEAVPAPKTKQSTLSHFTETGQPQAKKTKTKSAFSDDEDVFALSDGDAEMTAEKAKKPATKSTRGTTRGRGGRGGATARKPKATTASADEGSKATTRGRGRGRGRGAKAANGSSRKKVVESDAESDVELSNASPPVDSPVKPARRVATRQKPRKNYAIESESESESEEFMDCEDDSYSD